ncbi:hypothetical protein AXE65_07080 [Ventosimonas gracilis]|uniref:DUF1468 domain-containing protein n=1 Tax=Ventosimonas gracilis TaxID=1680762 RepID=A0A139SJ68_9GAMM|nr:tripartite tricarboxylate transporter TctB family protein [Ventosimonas gracilis]KXU34597.1 hypothetical protein AXE65_07080 [Ventosimonas gracilis]
MLQRSFSVLLLLICAALAVVAFGYQAPFSYEPVGPRAWPLILLALLGLGALALLLSPQVKASEEKPKADYRLSAKVSGCVLLLLIYAALFETLGFIPSAMLLGVGLARLYDGRWSLALASGLILGIGLYLLFDKALDVPLPLGVLSDWEI